MYIKTKVYKMKKLKIDTVIEDLTNEYTYKSSVNFEGNEEVEAFYGSVENFERDTDNTIIVSLRDMEDNVWQVNWDEVKDEEFDLDE